MPSSLMPPVPDGDETWLTARETSDIARVAEKTLANWRSLGIGPPYRKLSPGRAGRVRYARSQVIAWLNGDRTEEAA